MIWLKVVGLRSNYRSEVAVSFYMVSLVDVSESEAKLSNYSVGEKDKVSTIKMGVVEL